MSLQPTMSRPSGSQWVSGASGGGSRNSSLRGNRADDTPLVTSTNKFDLLNRDGSDVRRRIFACTLNLRKCVKKVNTSVCDNKIHIEDNKNNVCIQKTSFSVFSVFTVNKYFCPVDQYYHLFCGRNGRQ